MAQEGPLTPNEKLQAARKKCKWTQKDVAGKIEAPDHTMISDWERGKNAPQAHYREKLRNIFEMSDEELGFTRQSKKAIRLNNTTFIAPTPPPSPTTLPSYNQEVELLGNTTTDFADEQTTQEDQTIDSEPVGGNDTLNQHTSFQREQQLTRPQRLLPKTILLIICIFSVATICFAAIIVAIPHIVQPSPQIIQVQLCSANLSTDVIVHTTDKDYCFSGSGTIDLTTKTEFLAHNVISIETGHHWASWRYFKQPDASPDALKEQREPSNTNWKIHVCNGRIVSYPSPIHLTRLHIADQSKTQCTNQFPSAP